MADFLTDSNAPQEVVSFLPLRDVIVFPRTVINLFIGRSVSIQTINEAMQSDKKLFLVMQRSSDQDDPKKEDLHEVGCVGTILQKTDLPDNTIKILVEGNYRARLVDFIHGHSVGPADLSGTYFEDDDTSDLLDIDATPDGAQGYRCQVQPLFEAELDPEDDSVGELEALRRSVLSSFEHYTKLKKKYSSDLIESFSKIHDSGSLADTIAAQLLIANSLKQEILEIISIPARLQKIFSTLTYELEILKIEKRIRGNVKNQMEKSQREYYLNEQVKAIKKELGTSNEEENELEDLKKKIDKSGMTKEAKKLVNLEFRKLSSSSHSSEGNISRTYIDTLLNLPWRKKTKINASLEKASEILNQDHFGLEEVKERILEYLAVQHRVSQSKAPILCLVGPPGVGKTSLGQSIAKATNRKYTRIALGGMYDEAEIRGHRRTYMAAMPGKILQKISKAGVANPLMLLDEVDKLAGLHRGGDPSDALLEVLDPEQNSTFQDHYVEAEFDLSGVMFVATANTLKIQPALLDRMEIIRIPGYTEEEKLNIAERYLVRKQLENNGLTSSQVSISQDAIRLIIRNYTREAGVRSLEQKIAKIFRKIVRHLATDAKSKKVLVTPKNIEKFLGVEKFSFGIAEKENQIGQVTGLAWTEIGGDLLTIETVTVPGKGKLLSTGKLGEVMQESIQTALTVVRKRSDRLGIPADFYQKNDFHVHFPEGAIPKDGPSAGVGIVTALVSVLTGIPVRADVAMTGEITLLGEVLPIGGLKEKLLAALRGGISLVLIPEKNMKDLAEVPTIVKNKLTIKPVKLIDEVLSISLERDPEVNSASDYRDSISAVSTLTDLSSQKNKPGAHSPTASF